MAVSGTLAIKVHRLEATFVDEDLKNQAFAVKVAISGEERRTKYKPVESTLDQTLEFSAKNVEGTEVVTIEVYQEDRKKELVKAKLKLSDFFKRFSERKMTFTFGVKGATNTLLLFFSGEWRGPVPEESAATTTTTTNTTTSVSTLSTTETHRPWFLRAGYYYDTTKSVYNYTTSFRVVSPIARFYENTANLVLEKVTGKTLKDVDAGLLVPVLNTVDNTVDTTISTVLTKLIAGQQFVLKKKDDAVGVASTAASKTYSGAVTVKDFGVEKVSTATSAVYGVASSAASKTYNGTVAVKDFTVDKVSTATSTVVGTAASVADYAKTQVVNVSSSTYGTVRDTGYYVLSHVPILGPKIRA